MNLTIVIATRNRAEQVRRLVKELEDWDCEIIVVDDKSQEPFELKGAKIIRNDQRLGGGESWNVGSRYAKSDWLFLIADDLVPSPGLRNFIEKLLPRLDKKGLVGFRITGYNRIGSRTIKLPYRTSTLSRILNILFGSDVSRHTGPSRFTTGAMLVHSELYNSLGGFDSRTYTGNGFREESDLQLRARKLGGKLTYVEDPFFHHLDTPGGYRKRYSENEFYFMRNQTIFALKSGSPAAMVMIISYGVYLFLRGLRISMLVKGTAEGLAEVL